MSEFNFQLRDPLTQMEDPSNEPNPVAADSEGGVNFTPIPELEATVNSDEIETDDAFSYEGYQVVRGEFFAHINEPSITFNDSKVSLNTAAVNKLPDVEYVQILVNSETHQLVVKPSSEDIRDSFLWSTANKKNGKRKPKKITCRIFFAKVVELMNWNPDYRYKLLGKLIRTNDGLLFLFDLDATQIFRKTVSKDGRPVSSRKPAFPEDWKNQFGLPFEEHQKKLEVSIFSEYAVFGIRREEEESKNADAPGPGDGLPLDNSQPKD